MLELPEHNCHVGVLFAKSEASNSHHHVHAKVDMSKTSLLKNLENLRGSIKSGKESISALSGSVLGLRGSTAYESLNADSVLASTLLAKSLKHIDKIVGLVKSTEKTGVHTASIPLLYFSRRKLYNEFI